MQILPPAPVAAALFRFDGIVEIINHPDDFFVGRDFCVEYHAA
jgi:hypothetical protein